jgi:transglutaminase-like putative cysteine protease
MSETRFGVSHRTTYQYSRPMNDGYSLAIVTPRHTPLQTVERVEVVVEPQPDELAERLDVFGNGVLQLGIHRQHDVLTVDATSQVTVRSQPLDDDGPPWETVVATITEQRGGAALDVRPFAGGVPLVGGDDDLAALAELAGPAFAPGRPVVDVARTLCRDIHREFHYDTAFTEVSTPLAAVLEARRGVCQDFAHLAIGALRANGLAARYVSGYIARSADRAASDRTADASHAWCSVWVPSTGWVDFDPTNGHLPADDHITVAWGRDYGDVAPVRGVVIGPPATQRLTVAVDVARL